MSHFIVITGATRGFGRAMALRFATSIPTHVHFSLTGRSESDLDETKQMIKLARDARDWQVSFDSTIADLGDLTRLTLHKFYKLFSVKFPIDFTMNI